MGEVPAKPLIRGQKVWLRPGGAPTCQPGLPGSAMPA